MSFPLTVDDLEVAGVHSWLVDTFLAPLNAAMAEFGIDSGERPFMFLAQVSEESNGFRNLSEIWGPTPAQLRYPGGRAWSGHGLIQITGLPNHQAVAAYFQIPLDHIVAWLLTPEGACRSAAWYWATHRCNELADAFDFVGVTKAINGGTNGLARRTEIYEALNA